MEVNNDTTFYQDIKKVYKDSEENISQVGREIADAKNQVFDNISFGMTLIFIGGFGTMLIFGPPIFQSLRSFANRLQSNGLAIKGGF